MNNGEELFGQWPMEFDLLGQLAPSEGSCSVVVSSELRWDTDDVLCRHYTFTAITISLWKTGAQ